MVGVCVSGRLRYKDVWLCGCVEDFFDPPAGGVSPHMPKIRAAGAIFLKLFFAKGEKKFGAFP